MTGAGNRLILENIAAISRLNPNTIVRVPLLEEVNANEKNIKEMCEFLIQNAQVAGVELLPYHDFGEAKYSAVGAGSQKFTTPDAGTMDELKKIIAEHGLRIV